MLRSNSTKLPGLAAAALAALAGLFPADALAGGAVRVTTRIVQRGGGGGGGSGPSYKDSTVSPSIREINEARSEIAKVIARLRREFEQSVELRDARAALRQAILDYRTACDTALADLRAGAAYKQAAERVTQAQRRLDAARGNEDGAVAATPARIAALATDLMLARAAVSRMEAGVLSADDSVADARYAWQDANARVVQLLREFEQSIPANEAFQAARARLDAARRQLSRR